MVVQNCPDAETLQNLILGHLPDEQCESLEQHLLDCASCAEGAERLDKTDDLIDAIRSPRVLGSTKIDVDAVISRGQQIHQETRAFGNDDTFEFNESPDEQTFDLEDEEPSYSFLDPPEESDEVGRFGRYRILDTLGQGGMGIVFRAEEKSLRRQVALKVVTPGADKSARLRFIREARALAAVQNDHIVSIHCVGEVNSIPFLEMPVLRGESLGDRLKNKKRLGLREVCRVGEQSAKGLSAAHESGLVHRDIKPSNLWLESPEDRVKILDFGLARCDDDPELTRMGHVVGTPRYMAPEQANGQTADELSDLFSLGSVLYHCAAGRPPFEGRSTAETLLAVSKCTITPIKEFCPSISDPLAELISELLSSDPQQRPESASIAANRFREIGQLLDDANEIESIVGPANVPEIETADTVVAIGGSTKNSKSNSKETLYVKPTPKSISTPGLRTWGFVGAGIAVGLLFWLASIVMRFETPNGTIVLEIESSDEPVKINVLKQTTLQIIDPTDGQMIDIEIDKAEQSLRLEKKGFSALVKRFSLTSKEGARIAVRFEPRNGNTIGEVAGQLEIAEWVLRQGGKIEASGQTYGPDQLTSVSSALVGEFRFNFSEVEGLTDDDLEKFAKWTCEAAFDFGHSTVTGEGFRYLDKSQVTGLWCQECEGLKVGSFQHFNGSEKIESLMFWYSNAGDELAEMASTLPNLRILTLGRNSTGESLRALAGTKSLEELGVLNCQINAADFALLQGIPSLKSLTIGEEQLAAPFLTALASATQIKLLRIAADGELDIKAIAELSQIEHLDLSYRDLTTVDLSLLKGMSSLRELTLRSTGLSKEEMEELGDALSKCTVYGDNDWVHKPTN